MQVHPHKDLYHMITNMPSSQFGFIQEASRQILGEHHSPMYHQFGGDLTPKVHKSHYHDILQAGHKSTLAHRIAAEPTHDSGLRKAVLHAMDIAIPEQRRDRNILAPPPE